MTKHIHPGFDSDNSFHNGYFGVAFLLVIPICFVPSD